MDSILQSDTRHCFLCEMTAGGDPLDKHHVFSGAYRDKSEDYGLFVYLHHSECHIFGENSVHQCYAVREKLCRVAQKKAMDKYGWNIEDFVKIFGRSYI